MTIARLLRTAARVHADRVAIEAPGAAITYRALIERATALAATLRAGDIVELAAERSADFVIACIGAWLAGAAWAPIDPAEPAARRERMRARIAAARGTPDLAYVIPTSGSSGAPKAVMVSHRGLPALVRTQIDAFALAPGARVLWLHAPMFDASISDWTTTLVAGGTLVIPSGAPLRDELAHRAITHVDLPTALLAELAQPPAALRCVVLGGAPCPPAQVAALAARVRVVVVYGPTEATICTSLVVVDPARWTRPLLGASLPGIAYRVVDGELWIAGDAVALGYAGDPDETARRFVVDGGTRYYRTGDRVEPTASGLAFLGRIDRQHKLAGGRIELDEIEAVLRRCPGVDDAAVCVRPVTRGGRARLLAFVDATADVEAVRAWLSTELPRWMLPAQIIVGELPRTATGKVDHAALAARPLPPRPASEAEPRAAELAALWCDAVGAAELAALWCDALGTADVRAEHRFADRGGDSLAVVALHAAATARGLALDPAVLHANPSFAELVEHVRAAAAPLLTVRECERRGLAALDAAESSRRGRDVAALEAAESSRATRGGRAVLITGATGLLGSRVLAYWRARDDRDVIVLVRASDEGAARRRIAVPGIGVLCGDVAAPRFGLAPAAWQALAERVGTVVHAAAAIRLGDGWDGHAPANVTGTAEVARFAAAAGAVWHHVSTLSVFVGTDDPRTRFDETMLSDPDAHVFGGYAATKIAAEAIARAAGAATIVRLGLLTTAQPRATDQLAMTIRGLAKLGVVPAGCDERRFDVTPVDHAAAAVVELVLCGLRGGCDVHHVAAAAGARFGDLTAAIEQATGRPLAVLAPAAWADRARAQFADPDVALAYLAIAPRASGARTAVDPRIALAAGDSGARTAVDPRIALLAGDSPARPPVDPRIALAAGDSAARPPVDPSLARSPGASAARGAFDLFLARDFGIERTARILAERGVVAPPIDLAPVVAGALA